MVLTSVAEPIHFCPAPNIFFTGPAQAPIKEKELTNKTNLNNTLSS